MLELQQANSWHRLSVGGFCLISSIRMGIHPLGKAPPSTTAQRSARILVHPAILSSIGLEQLARGLLLEHALWFIGPLQNEYVCTGGATMRSLPPPILCGAYRSVATATARGQAAIAIKMLTSRKFGMPPSPSLSSINQPIVGRTD